jgi:hypothetical protein
MRVRRATVSIAHRAQHSSCRCDAGMLPQSVMRWLAPLLIIFVVFHTASTFAAAGVVNEVRCCCPDLEACTCHEHDEPAGPTQLNRCGGAVSVDAPVLTAVTLPEAPAPRLAPVRLVVVEHAFPIPGLDLPRSIEKPPS